MRIALAVLVINLALFGLMATARWRRIERERPEFFYRMRSEAWFAHRARSRRLA